MRKSYSEITPYIEELAKKSCEGNHIAPEMYSEYHVFRLYETVAAMAPELIAEKRKMYKGVSPNVDFYSGLIYRMLELPAELYTPIFAMSRIAGWSAHRIEELQNAGKIIRPAYINVQKDREYVPLSER